MAIARTQRALLDKEIDRCLEAGEDCAAISTILRCRFSDVQAGQRRLAERRAKAARAKHAAAQHSVDPETVDRLAADAFARMQRDKAMGIERTGGHYGAASYGVDAVKETVYREPTSTLPRHWGYAIPDDSVFFEYD